MIGPLTDEQVQTLPDVQILLRMKAISRRRSQVAMDKHVAEHGFAARPDALTKARQELAQLVAADNQVRNEAASRLMARREVKRSRETDPEAVMVIVGEGQAYSILGVYGTPLAKQAAEHAALTPGTVRVEDDEGNVLWRAQ